MIAVVGVGYNLASVLYGLERAGAKGSVTLDADEIARADRVILPGVGAAGAAMDLIQSRELKDCLAGLTQPRLSICLGMQLLFAHTTEDDTTCLGFIPERVVTIPSAPGLTTPHMGWNRLEVVRSSPLLKGVGNGAEVYFVHGYAVPPGEAATSIVNYGAPYTATIEADGWFGCQFHPERSGAVGAQILRNFLDL